MINLMLGQPGGGKSHEAVVFHLIPALKQGRKVITNLALVMEKFQAYYPEYCHLIEIREPFLSYRRRLPWRVVHGHTVTEKPDVRQHRIGIDTGAYAGGPLSCAVIERDSIEWLTA